MELTDDQSRALDAAFAWFKKGKGSFYIGGNAGTGKTSLAKYFAAQIKGQTLFGAFTGKAASVLRKNGCPNATTIHSMIYRPKGQVIPARMEELQSIIENAEADDPNLSDWQKELTALKTDAEDAKFGLRDRPEIIYADLVVIDEFSMIDKKMGQDLESFGKPILWLGDPGQLPPVRGAAHLDREPDVTLSEIHRQARGSPIIKLAHDIRMGRPVLLGDYGEVCVKEKKEFDWDVVMGADQVLCGKNITRQNLIRSMRKRSGRNNLYPVKGDKLICVKNDHEEGLLNGVTGTAVSDSAVGFNTVDVDVEYEGQIRNLTLDSGHFEESYGDRKSFPRWEECAQFAYGNAITVHKAQGSQWPHVVICDDKMRASDELARARWLYTAVTRAQERLTIYM